MPNYFLSGIGQSRIEFLEDRIGRGEELSPTLVEEYNLLSNIQSSFSGISLREWGPGSRISEPIRRLMNLGYLSTTNPRPRPTVKGRSQSWWLRN